MADRIRPASTVDAEAIATLIGSLVHYFVADPSAASVQPFLATFRADAIAKLLADPAFFCLCAEGADGLLGVLTLHLAADIPAHVHHLFVHPAAQRRGLARALWQAAQGRLPAATAVTVNASEYAVPVYQRLGFVVSADVMERNGVRYVPMRTSPEVTEEKP